MDIQPMVGNIYYYELHNELVEVSSTDGSAWCRVRSIPRDIYYTVPVDKLEMPPAVGKKYRHKCDDEIVEVVDITLGILPYKVKSIVRGTIYYTTADQLMHIEYHTQTIEVPATLKQWLINVKKEIANVKNQ